MTPSFSHDERRARAVDRLCELTSIGAGHAAGALATLLGRPIEMSVPRVILGDLADGVTSESAGDPRSWSGVFFDVLGGPGGTLALLLPPDAREAALAAMLGAEPRNEAQAASALSELGNVLVSHTLSAIGDTIGSVVLPSPPDLALRDAPASLARRLSREGAPLRIEIALHDRADGIRASLLYAPQARV